MSGVGRHVFFLGGQDLEMVAIRELLEQEAPGRFHDKRLRWGAKASVYREEIDGARAKGNTPVLVELQDDLGVAGAAVVVDHHGADAGLRAPTSLHQVFDLLALPRARWTRWHELVAANDRGYIPGLLAAGATGEEITRVRAADRAAQGVTATEEAEAERAVAEARRLCGGRLTVVRCGHSRLGPVEDRLHPALGGPGVENLLLLAPDEVDFSGEGALVQALDRRFPGGWYGGALPERGFWGRSGQCPEAEPYLVDLLTDVATTVPLARGSPRG